MFGASHVGGGSARSIIYNGNDTAIRFKRDNFDVNDFSEWIYGAAIGNFGESLGWGAMLKKRLSYGGVQSAISQT